MLNCNLFLFRVLLTLFYSFLKAGVWVLHSFSHCNASLEHTQFRSLVCKQKALSFAVAGFEHCWLRQSVVVSNGFVQREDISQSNSLRWVTVVGVTLQPCTHNDCVYTAGTTYTLAAAALILRCTTSTLQHFHTALHFTTSTLRKPNGFRTTFNLSFYTLKSNFKIQTFDVCIFRIFFYLFLLLKTLKRAR